MKFSMKSGAMVLILLAGGLYVYHAINGSVSFEEKKPAVNEAAPSISLADLSGQMVGLNDFKGKVVLVNFWASWCPPCKAEMPGFQRVYDLFEEKGFAVIGIVVDDVSPSLIGDLGITFPIVKTNARVTRDYGDIKDVPVSFLIGRDGRIIKKVKKTYAEGDLRRDVENALKQG